MLTRLYRRLHRAARRAYLQHKLKSARFDEAVIQAEAQTAPNRLALTRQHILALAQAIDEIDEPPLAQVAHG